MTLVQVLPHVKALPRNDKLRLIQDLAADLAMEEDALRQLKDAAAVPIWSPHDSAEGAATLQRVLDDARTP